jgi:hypothetical protein
MFAVQRGGRVYQNMDPEFPIRIIADDGSVEVLDSPEDLLTRVDSIDSTGPGARVWVRDAFDRTVRIRVRGGVVEELGLHDET